MQSRIDSCKVSCQIEFPALLEPQDYSHVPPVTTLSLAGVFSSTTATHSQPTQTDKSSELEVKAGDAVSHTLIYFISTSAFSLTTHLHFSLFKPLDQCTLRKLQLFLVVPVEPSSSTGLHFPGIPKTDLLPTAHRLFLSLLQITCVK